MGDLDTNISILSSFFLYFSLVTTAICDVMSIRTYPAYLLYNCAHTLLFWPYASCRHTPDIGSSWGPLCFSISLLVVESFFLNQQFITWDSMVDRGSYTRSLLKLEEKKGKERRRGSRRYVRFGSTLLQHTEDNAQGGIPRQPITSTNYYWSLPTATTTHDQSFTTPTVDLM